MFRTLILTLLLLSTGAAFGGDWQFVSDKDGVATWSRQVDDSKLLGFRGVSEVDVHVSRMVGAMLDASQMGDWVDLLTEHRVVGGQGRSQVIYQRYGMNWPVADRDYVLERTVRTYPEQHRTTVTVRSVTHPDAPALHGVVRAEVDRTFFAFTALPDGRTRVEVEAFTDPGGIVPQWLVNLVQKNWARTSITALAGVARRDRSPRYEAVRDW